MLKPLSAFVRLMLFCFGFCSVEVEDHRREDSLDPGIIVVSPHLTDIDILMLYCAFGCRLSALGDVNILKAPFVSWIGLAGQNVFVDLRSKDAKEACKEVIRSRAEPAWEGPPLAIFPEGRITNGRVLIQFRTGAFLPGKPVLPVLLRYPHRFFDPTGQSRANKSFLWPVRILTQLCNYCKVEILEPYAPSHAEQESPQLFADNVRAVMAERLGVGVTNHSYDDAQMFQRAVTLGMNAESMDFEVHEVTSKLSVDMEYLTECMREFRDKDVNGDGRIDRDEFMKGYRRIGHLFDFFDHDESNSISYLELINGLAVLSGKASPEMRGKLAFCSMDEQWTEKVSGRHRGVSWGPMNLEEFLRFAKTPQGKDVVDAELERLSKKQTREF
jgi:lysophosphatidylcholine acyltransferase/lyso-PAF acetyltransferase